MKCVSENTKYLYLFCDSFWILSVTVSGVWEPIIRVDTSIYKAFMSRLNFFHFYLSLNTPLKKMKEEIFFKESSV